MRSGTFLPSLFVLLASQGLAQVLAWHEIDGRTRTQRVEDRRPLDEQPYLGLYLGDELDKAGVSRCRARQMWQPGPALQADAVRRGDFILALNGSVVTSAQHFGQELDGLKPGSEARLKLRRDDKEIDVSVRVASRAEWATPLDVLRRPALGVKQDEIVPMHPGQSRFEQFLGKYLSRFHIEQPAGDLRRFLAGVVERFYSANMLPRVAYAFHRPTRMVELQASITSPLAAVVDRNKGTPWAVAGAILSEAAKNLDSSFAAGKLGQMDLAHPGQALKDASGMVRRAVVHLERAFEKIGAAPLDEMQTSLPALLDDAARRSPAAMRARMASLVIDYSGLFAAADSIASWSPAGEPPAAGQSVAIPKEIEGAVKGEVAAVERIEGRWYVYGGPGPNEYDLSRIDVVIDAGGDDLYRYSGKARPRIQLVVDWAGNDVYSAEGEIPGPASAILCISVVVDHQGDDRYEGGLRSCGAGLMGVGLILDHAGNDTYKGTKWSLGFGRYGFGGIVDLEDPPSVRTKGKYAYPDGSDMYLAQEASQAYGGPHGFGLILDGAGRDLYRLGGPPPVWGDRTVAYSAGQGVGYGDGLFDTGGIGVLCDLSGDDRYEAGEVSQGAGWLFGMGILYDRSGNDIYYGTRYSQGASAHGGVGILADDGGDDTYWGGIAGSWDLSLALLIDRRGNDSYQGDHRIGGLGRAGHQSIAWLLDLDGHDRYVRDHAPYDAPEYNVGMGESQPNGNYYKECQCFSLSVLLDAGGSSDFYSQAGRGEGISIAPGRPAARAENSPLHGLFIDTKEKVKLWP